MINIFINIKFHLFNQSYILFKIIKISDVFYIWNRVRERWF